MKTLICRQNIEQFRRLLNNNPDDAEREVLEILLAEEIAEAEKAEIPMLCAQESFVAPSVCHGDLDQSLT
jgi:hypothetical protein